MIGILLDIHKALDMTWRNCIYMKLYVHGFWSNLPTFVHNLVQDRTFSVKLPGNVISDVFVQENGLPECSVLSPILFCIMINDILYTTPVPRNLIYSLYADDCAHDTLCIYAQFSAGRIQDALGSIRHWASLRGFMFSVTNWISVVFTRRNVPD